MIKMTPKPNELTEAQESIHNVCSNLDKFLIEKNKRYGNSALNPRKVFSKLDAEEGIKVRMNDKISRIENSDELRKNDVWDLLGYLSLLIIAKGWEDPSELID